MFKYEEKIVAIRKKQLLVEVDKRGWGVVITVRAKPGGPSWVKALSRPQIEAGESGNLEYLLDGRVQVLEDRVIINESPWMYPRALE
ncbi:MAG: hypothetical protein JW704_00720 [Anaerolineaceae bacterium]|nr:hypothetical protein [Anaerolineaceae bacterium]